MSIPHPSCVLELALFGHGGGGNDTVSGVAQIPLRVLPEETVLSKWISFSPRNSTVVTGQVLLRVIITNQSSFRSPEGYENGLPQGCPWQCGMTLYPCDLDKHLVCCPNAPDPSAIIACPNAIIGCPVVARRDLSKALWQMAPLIIQKLRNQPPSSYAAFTKFAGDLSFSRQL